MCTSKNIGLKFLCEFVGTFGLVFTVFATVANNGNGALAAGAFLCAYCYAFGHVSGTHVNPAVSCGVFMWTIIETGFEMGILLDMVIYMVAQFIGAILGGVLAAAVVGGIENFNPIVQLFPYRNAVGFGPEFAMEFFAVWFFVLVILRCCCSKLYETQTAGIPIGLALTAGLFFTGPVTGGCMNPAAAVGVMFGNMVISGLDVFNGEIMTAIMHMMVAYMVAPFVGAFAALGVHACIELCWDDSKDDDEANQA